MLKKLLIILAVLVAAAVVATLGRSLYRGAVERRDAEERAASPQGRLPESVEPLSYELSLRIDPTVDSFSGRSRIAIRIHEPTDVVWLHGKDLRAEEASLQSASRTPPPPRRPRSPKSAWETASEASASPPRGLSPPI